MKLKQILLSTTVVASAIYFADSACAQDAAAPQNVAQQNVAHDDGGITEVVVTAQRTQSLASKTPVALTAVSGENLRKDGIADPTSLGSRVPNLQMDTADSGLRITIRGVSSQDTTEKGDPSAAFMLDGIYIARPQVQNVSFFDVARVEVLRGPQGTLYGRNTTAGAVNIISNSPGNHFAASLNAEIGNYNSRKLDGMINLPVNDRLALRAAFAVNKHDSELINGQGTSYHLGLDRDDVSMRLSAKLRLTDHATLVLRLDNSQMSNNDDSSVPVSNFYTNELTPQATWYSSSTKTQLTNSFVPGNGPLQQGYNHAKTTGLSADFNWDLGPVTLSYLGSHRSFDRTAHMNYHFELAPGFTVGARLWFWGHYKQDSHELRVATNGDGPLKAQAGIYYFREESHLNATFLDLDALGLPPYYAFPQGPTTAVGKAVFAQGTYSLTDKFRMTAGVRYSEDEKARYGSSNSQQAYVYNPATDTRTLNAASLNTHKMIWRLGAEYDLAPKTLVFATLSTGYKAGGFNDGCLAGSSYNGLACTANVALPRAALFYQPEVLTSMEAGIKTKFWDNKARMNASVFSYDYTNLQLSGAVIVNGAPQLVTTNAAKAKVTGIEVEGEFVPSSDDHLSYSVSLLDAHYVNYKPDGTTSWADRKLDRSPNSVISAGYDHTFHVPSGSITASVFTRVSAAYYISVPSQLVQYKVPSQSKTDLSVTYNPSGASWYVQGFLKNLENKVAPVSIDSIGQAVPSEPQTFGVRFGTEF